MTFWQKLIERGTPIVGLSPMDGVTDAVMRYMSAKYGGPDVMFSEFVSVDALHYAVGERRERLLKTFIRVRTIGELGEPEMPENQSNRSWPYEIAQVFGNKPELFSEAAELIESLGFDGIDINMGCPAHKVEENGSGAGLIRTPEIAQEIVKAVKNATKLPVSVKTRIGVDKEVVSEWMEALMEVSPAMISLHGRTLRQLYQGSADWEAIGRAAEIVHARGGHILGNGDVQSVEDGMAKVKQYGVDGFLIGRCAEGNPSVFLQSQIPNSQILKLEPTQEQRLAWVLEHAKLHEQVFGVGNFMPVRKHLAWYCKGFAGAGELRTKLVQANSAAEVVKILVSK